VPNVLGTSLAKAETQIKAAGLTVGPVSDKASSTIGKGDVIGTNPSYGTTEPKGTAVALTVSTGPKIAAVNVPYVINDTRGAAVGKLRRAGFRVQVTAGTQAGAAPNTVINQSPAPNTSAPKGSVVTITVTSNATLVPDVVNMTQAQAMSILEGKPYFYHVTVQTGTVSGAVGTVYATSPSASSALPPGSSITIYVVGAQSSSPSPTPSTSSSSPGPTPTP
jgi:serine/threonine-protein kinase